MTYFLYLDDGAGVLIDPEQFAQQLRAKWPNATVNAVNDPTGRIILDWEVLTEQVVLGSLTADRTTLLVDGDLIAGAQFALWYRTLVPLHIPLYYADREFDPTLELTAETTLADMCTTFGFTHP